MPRVRGGVVINITPKRSSYIYTALVKQTEQIVSSFKPLTNVRIYVQNVLPLSTVSVDEALIFLKLLSCRC